MKKPQVQPKNHTTEQNFNNLFQLNQTQILDKNVGYVSFDKEDILKQYDEINKKQHFGKAVLKEEWYLKNIFQKQF